MKNMSNKEIVNAVEESIKKGHKQFKQQLEEDILECDIHFALYHIISEDFPELFELDEYWYKEGKKEKKAKGRRIYAEFHTQKYGEKQRRGRFDLAIFDFQSDFNNEIPLIAIEIKIDTISKIENFEQDFIKLSDGMNKIKFPVFLYVDYDIHLSKFEDLFKKLSIAYPNVRIYYSAQDRLTLYFNKTIKILQGTGSSEKI